MSKLPIHSLIRLVLLVLLIALLTPAQTQPSDTRPLSLNQPIGRELKGGEAHSYNLALDSGQFVYLLVNQRGIDVVVTVFGPDGSKLSEVDSPNFWQGLEPVSMVTDTAGSYRFEVRARKEKAVPGRYQISMVEFRAATEQDKSRVAIEQQFNDAQQLEADETGQSMQSAITKYEQVLPLLRAVGDSYREALALYSIGRIALGLGQHKKALDYFEQTLGFTRIAGYQFGEAEVLNNIGQVYLSLGEKDKALDYFGQALEPITQTLRERKFAMRYEQECNDLATTRYKLAEFKRKLDSRQANGEEARELNQLETEFKTASDGFSALLKQAEEEFSGAIDHTDKIGAVPDTLNMQASLRQLDQETGERTVAVYTLRGENRYYGLLVTADGLTSVSTPIKGSELDTKALKLWGLLQSDDYDPKPLSYELYQQIFKPIENKLPPSTKTIIWSLDGNLRYVPIAALYDGKRYLVERYNHVNFTRADKERLIGAVTRNWTATGLGTSAAHTVELLDDKITFDNLPGVGEELRLLFKHKDNPLGIFEGETLQDARFTKASMFSALKQKRPLVHIASHFAFRPGDAERSFLLVGDGTAFTLAEMKQQGRLFEGVELLTLSACNTAAQQSGANGREIDAFAELAQRLGANAVMATLWPVADTSTPWLMREFYQIRQKQMLNKAEALRRAQLSLLQGMTSAQPMSPPKRMPKVQVLDEDAPRHAIPNTRADVIFGEAKHAKPFKRDPANPFAHPYYWSPFVLFGNWK